jgi:hypothetical protein
MPDALIRFLIDVSIAPARLARYRRDPEGEMKAARLSESEAAALRSRDCSVIRDALHDGTADLLGFLAALMVEHEAR